ncbi:MAG: GDP-mannose mannosyl hydrolase [Hydrogenovibrio sp.]|uniref:GDP-mannose mannosyl hydrolase n=1 Tax=Hydrogenovibrio sp. TaxID=2065821 RepID=UPI0028702AE3|nr:GDP-mannose mannosyl hydrolase [Hydrogenovibrio sp.]MDR9500038.1 GDP-mannose mannosyl hydrolase [Hydrogenovibrio sp.]
MLNEHDFKNLVRNAPLFAIDLVVLNDSGEILLGQRKNAPAKGDWFVPGGRVHKNEPLADAFKRISQVELGQSFEFNQAWSLGLYDHFYDDSVFGKEISTHYVNAPYLIRQQNTQQLDLPTDQHQDYRWVSMEQMEQDNTVHKNSKVFLGALKNTIKNCHVGIDPVSTKG